PHITLPEYLMYGRVSVVTEVKSGNGVINSIVLKSDDGDELDVEIVGSNAVSWQSNYFVKGDTTTYDRMVTIDAPTLENGLHNFTIEWLPNRVAWYYDGVEVRVLTPETSQGLPTAPCRLSIGGWSVKPESSEWTIDWAKGLPDFSQGPYGLIVHAITVQDFSSGLEYEYADS
ncbi:glycoside hydrolase family 16 protein, partial [Tortispora caseinolytica NRRL Y-17796]